MGHGGFRDWLEEFLSRTSRGWSETKTSRQERNRQARRLLLEGLEKRHLLAALPQMLVDLNPGGVWSWASEFTEVGGVVFFADDSAGREADLWKTDGTRSGTAKVTTVAHESLSSSACIGQLVSADGVLAFTVSDHRGSPDDVTDDRVQLWKSDGTSAGTKLVWDFGPASTVPMPSGADLTAVGGSVFGVLRAGAGGTSDTGYELFYSDLDETNNFGTYLVKDINPGPDDSYPSDLLAFGGKLYFAADDGAHGRELWVSDGKEHGTKMVANLKGAGLASPDDCGSYPAGLTAGDGMFFFSVLDPGKDEAPKTIEDNHLELWQSDGTTTGLVCAFEDGTTLPGGAYSFHGDPELTYVPQTGKLFGVVEFDDKEERSRDLVCWDERDMHHWNLNLGGDDVVGNLSPAFGLLGFGADDGVHGREPWLTDGDSSNPSGTVMIKDINDNGASLGFPTGDFFPVVGGAVYFPAYDDAHGEELWRSDGSVEGTELVADINPNGHDGSYPHDLSVALGKLFFVANDGEHDDDPWALDPAAPGLDFGDAPDPTYPTLLANNGARHTLVAGFHLGARIDAEADGQADAQALGDDNDGSDDEDGVQLLTRIVPGTTAWVEVTASAAGYLNAWLDGNADGDWNDPGEHFATDLLLAAGANRLPFAVPVDAVVTPSTFARFRFSSQPGLDYRGWAPDGEVEDYEVPIHAVRQWVVDSTGDGGDVSLGDGICDSGSGFCTLGAAIQEANALANPPGGPDEIAFAIPGAGPHTIQPASALPTITGPVVIDATTQPGYAGAPLIELDGTNAGASANGLWIAAGNSTVRGLAVNRFGGNGIQLTTAGGNTIEGNYLGINLAGTADRGNREYGLRIAGSHGNTIGGTTAAARNLISGNDQSGMLIIGANSNTILGNYIGTEVTGESDRRNTLFGIVVTGASSGTTIGGVVSGSGNVISGNGTAGIALSGVGVTNTLIQGNRIGTNPGGTGVVPNVTHGVQVTDGSFGNTIGGTVAGSGNVISGNLSGIFVKGGGSNQVLGNRIGTDVTGTVDLGNRGNGIQIDSSSTGNTVGGLVAGAGNVISGNNAVGVALSGSGTQNNVVQGNWIGTSASGAADLGNTSFGVLISGAVNNVVGGTVSGASNVISGNDNMGVVIAGATATGNRVEGNRIGTDAGGTVDLGNSLHGVQISGGANGNTIGGAALGAGNLISGNDRLGVLISGSGTTGNMVQGNRVGTRLDGDAALGNSLHGVQISSSASGNVIGGTAVGAGNQISGNVQSGVFLSGAANNLVQGNLIGTNAAGTGSLGNGLNGVQISSSLATGNTIGGSVAGAANVISGNVGVGLVISESASGNVAAGNRIGTDVSGTVDLGNGTFGVLLSTAFNNTLGGTASGAGNVISGNNSSGIVIQAGSGNTVQGNRIGTDAAGVGALANSLYGILLLSNTTGNTIGGAAAGEGNTIANNGAGGVRVQNLSVSNAIRGNAIFNNVGVGLDLVGTGGMTPNDPGDPDAGPNRLQNFPVISSAVLSGSNLTITYVVDSATVNSSYALLIDVYRTDGAGQEGASYLATDTYAAAVAQTARTVTLAVSGLSVNQRIVATATDALGNTSEFSASVVVASPLLAPAEVQRASSSATLDAAELGPLVWQAIAAWESAGLDAAGVAALHSLSFEVSDLPGRYLGLATRDRIVLDLDAAGYGWYVADASGEVSDEFEISDLKSQMDLLTAVMHEMGHALGLADLEDDLMAGVLQPGTRRLPTRADVDQVLAGSDWFDVP